MSARLFLYDRIPTKIVFGFQSDIDLCVEGLADERYFEAVGKLLLEADEFDIDLNPFENRTSKMEQRIKKGKVLGCLICTIFFNFFHAKFVYILFGSFIINICLLYHNLFKTKSCFKFKNDDTKLA